MSNQAKNEIDPNLAARVDALADECARAQSKADDVTEQARQHLKDAVAAGDLADSKASNRFQRRFIATLSGEPVADGPLSGEKCVLNESQKAIYVTVRKWLQRARDEAGIKTVRKDGKAKETGKAKAKGADQKSGKKAEQSATPQAAWDRLQMAALEIADAKARAACQKSLANVAKHLNLDSGE